VPTNSAPRGPQSATRGIERLSGSGLFDDLPLRNKARHAFADAKLGLNQAFLQQGSVSLGWSPRLFAGISSGSSQLKSSGGRTWTLLLQLLLSRAQLIADEAQIRLRLAYLRKHLALLKQDHFKGTMIVASVSMEQRRCVAESEKYGARRPITMGATRRPPLACSRKPNET